MGVCGNLIGREKTIEIKIKNLSKRMTSYYCFQKKIENIFKFDNLLFNYDDSLFKINNKDKFEQFYILDYDWIRNWKENSHFNQIKTRLDEIYSVSNVRNIIDLRTKCQLLENEGVIKNVEFPFTNNGTSYNYFISNINYKLEDFDCLLDAKTYKSFKEMSFWNRFSKEFTLEGIISQKIIILFVAQMQIVKFIYNGKTEKKDNELIQLTANCLELNEESGEFDMKESLLKYEAFKKFLINKNDQEIIDIFEGEAMGFLEEIKITFNKYQITIKNETLFSKKKSSKKIPKKIINFQNILNF